MVFRGPADLGTATLEVTPPAGFFGPYTPITDAFNPNARDAAGNYTLVWRGPWTYESGGVVRPMPAGNYRVVIKGTRAGTSLPPSEPYDKISLVEVKEIKFRFLSGDPAERSNPGPGGGSRIFAEAAAPAPIDQVGDNDKVEVIATIFPPVPDPGPRQLTLYFRGLDVDDPSAGRAPIDDEDFTYDNCLGGGCAVPSAGNVKGQNADVPVGVVVDAGQSEVTAAFQVAGRQGDNYRVAASTSDTWLRGLSATQNSPSGEVTHASGDPLAEGTHFTEMLTVWRTLHLEVDRLDSNGVQQYGPDPTDSKVILDVTGTITALNPQRLTDASAPFITATAAPGPDADHSRPNDWRGADLWPKDPPERPDASARVIANGRDYLEVGSTTDLTALASVGDSYRLSDDLAASLAGNLPLGMAERILQELYVRLDAAPPGNSQAVQSFRRNLESEAQRRLGKDLRNSPTFWAILLVDAFDGPVRRDNDPNVVAPAAPDEVPWLGATTSKTVAGSEPVCGVFRETVREGSGTGNSPHPHTPETALEIVATHEILCHALGNSGAHRTILEELEAFATLCRPYERGISEGFGDLSEVQRSRIRRLPVPTTRRIQ